MLPFPHPSCVDGYLGIGVNPTTNTVYVAATGGVSGGVSVISGASNAVVATVPVGNGPDGVGVNPATNTVYVTNGSDSTVSVISGA